MKLDKHRSQALSDNLILTAYQEACTAEANYALKALICGQMLLEKKALMSPLSHSETTGRFKAKKEEDNFGVWCEKVGIRRATAYRWMDAADRVARIELGLNVGDDLPTAIEVDGVAIPLSQALLAPAEELPEKARAFRQGVFDFMQDKSLAEAVRAAVDGEDDAHRISRAGLGKKAGGTRGEDRKDWPAFVARKLVEIGGHLSHWEGMSEVQRTEIKDLLVAAVNGDQATLRGRNAGLPFNFEIWPEELCSVLAEAVKQRNRRNGK